MHNSDWNKTGFGTKVVHAGQHFDPETGALATPIYQTSTFCFDTVEEGVAKFAKEVPGFVYTRGGNPTTRALELKVAAIEGGEDCVATASGMGAIGSVMVGLLKTGDHIVSGNTLYGGTSVVMHTNMKQFGIDVTFVDVSDPQNVANALRENTKIVYFETPDNPMLKLADIAAIAEVCKGKGVKIVVDNTFAPPPIQYPLALGADIVVHSVTKYLNGHGDVVGGVVIGSADDIKLIRGNAVTKLNGTPPSPFNAYMVLRGLKTLHLRIPRHCESALKVARYLESQKYVKWVSYPGLESHPQHELAKRQMNGLYTGMIAFELQDEINGLSALKAGMKLVNSLTIPAIAVSLGDVESLIEQPATMTHNNVAKEEREALGITDGLLRLSVGLEDAEDLIADFENAFAQL